MPAPLIDQLSAIVASANKEVEFDVDKSGDPSHKHPHKSSGIVQVVTKQRVADHGEVYTHPREVNAMLDLVKHEVERIESRFLEPACGTGNFLVEILSRKLAVVESRYKKSQFDFERYAVIAVSSIYGIEILADNVAACQTRLFEAFNAVYTRLYQSQGQDACRQTVRFILSRNVLHGDALTLKTVLEPIQAIVFSEWSAVNSSQLKRRDFVFDHLVKFSTPPPPDDLFSVENINRTAQGSAKIQQSDEGNYSYEVTPTKDYPPIHFLELGNV